MKMSPMMADLARNVGLSSLKRAAGVVTRLLPIGQPTMMIGPGASQRLGQAVNDFGHRKILIVTDKVISALGLMEPMTSALMAGGTQYVVYDEVTPDAPLPLIEKGIAIYQSEGCDAIIAFGGGSAMDAAKTIALAATNHKSPRQLVGYFKGMRAPAPLYAVPTTAGTGSEVTVAAVVSDPVNNCKLVIADTRLIPRMAALDPSLMTGLPRPITAATGMDALTHAVEAFIGQWCTDFTDRMALSAVGMARTWWRARRWRWPPATPDRHLRAPTSAMCTLSRTSSAASTTRLTGWPTPSCCRMCSSSCSRPSCRVWRCWRYAPA